MADSNSIWAEMERAEREGVDQPRDTGLELRKAINNLSRATDPANHEDLRNEALDLVDELQREHKELTPND